MAKRYSEQTIALDAYAPAPYNPRTISKHDMANLRRSIKRWGDLENVVVNKRTGHIVSGHQRVEAARAAGRKDFRAVVIDVDEAEEKLINLAMNRVRGEWDEPRLGALLGELGELPGVDVSLAGFGESELSRLVTAARKEQGGKTDEDAVPEAPEPVSKRGDLWVCGDHRLLCGDATKAEDVERLMGGEKPGLTVTDPPYGVEYDPAWRQDAYEKGLIRFGAKRVGLVSNDDRLDWREAWSLVPSDVLYCWHSDRHASVAGVSLETAGFEVRCQIIWRKATFVLGRGSYHWQHEPCWYAVRKGATAHWIGDRSQSTVWDINGHIGYRSSGVEEETPHGTQKPVECMERPIRNHEAPEVYDPFLGSGTTMIACEKLGRRCFGMEIEPRYVDVAVRRWEEYTGRKAKRAA